MSTIKELLDGRELPINVCCSDPLLKDIYYTITHKNEQYVLATCYYKENNIKISDSFLLLSSENWELYIEPKKKVKVALYAYKYHSEKIYKVTHCMYRDNQHAIEGIGPNCIVKRLDYTEIEVLDE